MTKYALHFLGKKISLLKPLVRIPFIVAVQVQTHILHHVKCEQLTLGDD